MNSEARELKAFLDAIAADPRDMTTRLVFADWLDEHNEPELADEQRKFSVLRFDAEQWMKGFCLKYEADYDELLAGIKSGDGYCFGGESGPYEARSDSEFWANVKVTNPGQIFAYGVTLTRPD